MAPTKTLRYAEEQKTKSKAFANFLSGIRTESSKIAYTFYLRKFVEFHNIGYDDIPKMTTAEIDTLVEKYVEHLKGRDLKSKTLRQAVGSITHFCTMNDLIYHSARIGKTIQSEQTKPAGGKKIETDDVRKLLSATKSPRMKALIHFFASTGVRPAALIDPEPLKMKHLKKIEDCTQVTIYYNHKEEYVAFLTPEATKALEDYFNWRKTTKWRKDSLGRNYKQAGETLDSESPVFVTANNQKERTHLTDEAFRQALDNLIRMAGIKRVRSGRRFESASIYGFRKRFNTILKISEANDNIVEKLMGHKRGLDGTYLAPTPEECFAEFKKAIPVLTVDQTERQRMEIDKKDETINHLMALGEKLKMVERRLRLMEATRSTP